MDYLVRRNVTKWCAKRVVYCRTTTKKRVNKNPMFLGRLKAKKALYLALKITHQTFYNIWNMLTFALLASI